MIKQLVFRLVKPIENWSRPPFELPDLADMVFKGVPLGMLTQVAPTFKAPHGTEYVVPEGQILKISEYEDLRSVLMQNQIVFGIENPPAIDIDSDHFKLPDLRAKIAVGHPQTLEDHEVIGGIKTVMRIK